MGIGRLRTGRAGAHLTPPPLFLRDTGDAHPSFALNTALRRAGGGRVDWTP